MQSLQGNGEQQLKDAGEWPIRKLVPRYSREQAGMVGTNLPHFFELPIGIPMNFELFMEKYGPKTGPGSKAKWAAAMKTGSYAYEHRIQTDSGLKMGDQKARIEFGASAEP